MRRRSPGATSGSPGPSRAQDRAASAAATGCSRVGPGRSAAIFPLLATVLFALLALAWAPPASAGPASAAPTQRLAVLELTGTTDRAILSVFSDQIRQGALLAVKPLGYEVMTRENQAALATAMGIDLEACQDGAECEVELGRNIGADLVDLTPRSRTI